MRLFDLPRLYSLGGAPLSGNANELLGNNTCGSGSGDDNTCGAGNGKSNSCGSGSGESNTCEVGGDSSGSASAA